MAKREREREQGERDLFFAISLSECTQQAEVGQIDTSSQKLHPNLPLRLRGTGIYTFCCYFHRYISRDLD